MADERREAPRFQVNLFVSKINDQELSGQIKVFSRRGMKVVLDAANINEKDEVQVEIQQPGYNELVSVTSLVAGKNAWKENAK